MMTNKQLGLEDIFAMRDLLGHKAHSEFGALHPDYRSGKEHNEWNKAHRAMPVTLYTRSDHGLAGLVQAFHKDRMTVIGLNERPKVYRNENGAQRSAKEHEIDFCANVLVDLDFEEKKPSTKKVKDAKPILEEICTYYQDLGLVRPKQAFSGAGYHLLSAIPRVSTERYSDLSSRIKKFTDDLRSDITADLGRHEMKLDNVHDLRRMLKIYGTAKPKLGAVSYMMDLPFREEDPVFIEHLLSLVVPETRFEKIGNGIRPLPVLNINEQLPSWFEVLLGSDTRVRSLWSGRGKANGDLSPSGYDYSLVHALIRRGHKDVDDLATILASRPDGSFQTRNKGEDYIRRTIANALVK